MQIKKNQGRRLEDKIKKGFKTAVVGAALAGTLYGLINFVNPYGNKTKDILNNYTSTEEVIVDNEHRTYTHIARELQKKCIDELKDVRVDSIVEKLREINKVDPGRLHYGDRITVPVYCKK